jgi:hypothetical protein
MTRPTLKKSSRLLNDFHDSPETFWLEFCNECHHTCWWEISSEKPESCEKELIRQIKEGEWE